ncbi:hypothetical protein [Frederiksenia canicola]|uniref:Transmembrane protein n=1 Tax=Frederiksenia canicola TaxID=123824 RepID=A0AAE6X6N1_9PAST|nr:hypothetical protein [Frederiksenia canicola]QIM64869.1 hypothetical protein A4G17_05185 [Frederiksenia canicola]RPE92205.1 hypothetical protein EDC49_1490 [Frederiksenia canicola]
MENKQTLWIFPILTQLIFSLFLPFFGGFNWLGMGYIFLFTTLPAFLFAIVCVRYQFHQRNLVQLAFWSGSISFVSSLVLFSLLTAIEPLTEPLSIWEHTLAVIFYALMFALPSMAYAMVVLGRFLPKKTVA